MGLRFPTNSTRPRFRNLYDQVSQSQEMPITSAQNKEIEEAAWNEVVNQILIEQELARRGIRVTDREIQDAARFSPPPELSGDPFFQTEGVFDIQKYQEFLARSADELLLLQLEAYYREIIPRSKLLRQVTSGIYFTDSELWDQYRFENEQVRIQFVAMNPVRPGARHGHRDHGSRGSGLLPGQPEELRDSGPGGSQVRDPHQGATPGGHPRRPGTSRGATPRDPGRCRLRRGGPTGVRR
jgi:hypothetical protein